MKISELERFDPKGEEGMRPCPDGEWVKFCKLPTSHNGWTDRPKKDCMVVVCSPPNFSLAQYDSKRNEFISTFSGAVTYPEWYFEVLIPPR